MIRRSAVFIVLLAVAAACSSQPSGSAPGPDPIVDEAQPELIEAVESVGSDNDHHAELGFSPGGGFRHESDSSLAEDLEAMVDVGSEWIRLDVDWSVVEHDEGEYDWESTDRLIEAALDRGLNVLGMVAYSPTWARPADASDKSPPTDDADFARFAAAAVERYRPRGVTTWEVWNEPNSDQFWDPRPDPARYAELLVTTATEWECRGLSSGMIEGGHEVAEELGELGWLVTVGSVAGIVDDDDLGYGELLAKAGESLAGAERIITADDEEYRASDQGEAVREVDRERFVLAVVAANGFVLD